MERAAAGEEGWGRPARIVREQPDFVAHVLQRGRATRARSAPASCTRAERPGRAVVGLVDDTKVALEHLFWSGRRDDRGAPRRSSGSTT